jgi:hypothetical protein
MRRLLLVLLAMLALVPNAHAWTWPADGRILAPFAFDPGNPYAAGQHRGIDVAGAPSAPVRAPATGSVSFAGTVPGSGRSVTIETPDGWSVTLTHLGQLAVKKDAAVAEGDPVGTLADGSSGDDPYVQLGIRRTADAQGYVDPLAFLPARPVAAPPAPAAASPADAPPVPLAAARAVAADRGPAALGGSAARSRGGGVRRRREVRRRAAAGACGARAAARPGGRTRVGGGCGGGCGGARARAGTCSRAGATRLRRGTSRRRRGATRLRPRATRLRPGSR